MATSDPGSEPQRNRVDAAVPAYERLDLGTEELTRAEFCEQFVNRARPKSVQSFDGASKPQFSKLCRRAHVAAPLLAPTHAESCCNRSTARCASAAVTTPAGSPARSIRTAPGRNSAR